MTVLLTVRAVTHSHSVVHSGHVDKTSADLIIIHAMICATEQLLVRNCNHSESKHAFNYRSINKK